MRSARIVSVLMALLFGIAVAGIAVAGEGPAEIVLKAKKGDVHFTHHKHQAKFQCGECHHGPDHSAYKPGMKIQTCDKCHTKDFQNKKLNSVMKAMHTNCRGCHKEHKADGAPTKCSGCHKK
ncbi:MAG: cytochrome c3 family protein [Thermodesulfobacteria bacterium]|nr:cytochrome c3 family protein [Thermodesulfobacteriota bacterium]